MYCVYAFVAVASATSLVDPQCEEGQCGTEHAALLQHLSRDAVLTQKMAQSKQVSQQIKNTIIAAINTTATKDVFDCDMSHNFVRDAEYSQISLTDGCPNCFGGPKYGGEGRETCEPRFVAEALAYCKAECTDKRPGCTGFFFQKHNNGHEICGFYSKAVNATNLQKGGHQPCSQVCILPTYKVGCSQQGTYGVFDAQKCCGDGYELISSEAGCQAALHEAKGQADVVDVVAQLGNAQHDGGDPEAGEHDPMKFNWGSVVPGCFLESKGRRRGVFVRFNTEVPDNNAKLGGRKTLCTRVTTK